MIFLEIHQKSPKKRNDLKFCNDIWTIIYRTIIIETHNSLDHKLSIQSVPRDYLKTKVLMFFLSRREIPSVCVGSEKGNPIPQEILSTIPISILSDLCEKTSRYDIK